MLTVLLIEDDDIDAEVVIRTIAKCRLEGECSQRGANVVHVDYFQKGLDVLRGDKPVDIVLLDLHLPDGRGTELVRTLSEEFHHVPVIVLTGLEAGDDLGVQLVSCGAQDYMPKSQVNEASLTRSIQYAISRHKLSSKVKEQADELKFANEELETFTYIASHDLRSPLVNLKGFSSELKRSLDKVLPVMQEALPQLNEDQQLMMKQECEASMPKAIDFIRNSAAKMDRMTEAILQLSRLGRRVLNFEKINLNNLVKQCVQSIDHQLNENGTEIIVEELPDVVTDRHSIEQIFSNLLDNAVKYLDPARKGVIKVSGQVKNDFFEFRVEDNGRGIAEDDKNKVFEIFRRAGDVKDIAGEGMGMPFVRSIVKRLGGSIGFESEQGKGTTFYFTIEKTPLAEINN